MKKIFLLSFLLCLHSLNLTQANNIIHPAKQEMASRSPVGWANRPILNISNDDLQNQNRSIAFKLYVLDTGTIVKTEVVQSSGLAALDQKVERALLKAKFKPYIENDTAYPFIVVQPFSFQVSEDTRPWWKRFFGLH
jgi:TonB family protein